MLGLNSVAEPHFLVYKIDNPALTRAAQQLKSSLSHNSDGDELVGRCNAMRIQRVRLMENAIATTVCSTLKPHSRAPLLIRLPVCQRL
jgi:hypothetical protein